MNYYVNAKFAIDYNAYRQAKANIEPTKPTTTTARRTQSRVQEERRVNSYYNNNNDDYSNSNSGRQLLLVLLFCILFYWRIHPSWQLTQRSACVCGGENNYRKANSSSSSKGAQHSDFQVDYTVCDSA